MLAERAGIPAGVFNVLTGEAKEIGGEMTSNPDVRKITFTGSTEVGRLLMKQSADTIKKLSLELGGNAPFIVFDDADLDEAVEGAIISKDRNAGQTCVCANRLYVQAGVYDAFAEKLVAAVGKLKVGNGFDPEVLQGPLIDFAAVREDRRSYSGCCRQRRAGLAWRQAARSRSNVFRTDSSKWRTSQMKVAREETFGPLAPLFRFGSDEEGYSDGQRHRVWFSELLLQPRHRPGLASRGSLGMRNGRHQYGTDLQ